MLKLDQYVSDDKLIKDCEKIVLSVRNDWTKDDLNWKIFTEGITNKLLGFWTNKDLGMNDALLVKVYGGYDFNQFLVQPNLYCGRNQINIKTETMIDREEELKNIKMLSELGSATPIYAEFNNGICYGYVQGVTLDFQMALKVDRLVIAEMVRIHAIKPKSEDNPVACVWKKLHDFVRLLPCSLEGEKSERLFKTPLPSRSQLEKKSIDLEKSIKTKVSSPIVFCHNDLTLDNIVWDKVKNRTFFIDFEYGGFNYLAYDIAVYFVERCGFNGDIDTNRYPEEQCQKRWLLHYLKLSAARDRGFSVDDDPSKLDSIEIAEEKLENLYADVQKFAAVTEFLSCLWGLIQADFSSLKFDFVAFAISKWSSFIERKRNDSDLVNI